MNPSDEIVGNERITRLHKELCEGGWSKLMNELVECEPAVVGYAYFGSCEIKDHLTAAGVETEVAEKARSYVLSLMLVSAEAVREASRELWADLIEDEPAERKEDPHD